VRRRRFEEDRAPVLRSALAAAGFRDHDRREARARERYAADTHEVSIRLVSLSALSAPKPLGIQRY